MHLETFSEGSSLVHRLDPRLKIVEALAFAVVVAIGARLDGLAAAMIVGLGLVAMARLPAGQVISRLATVNVFILFLWFVVPFSHGGGDVLVRMGPLALTREGLREALVVTLKCNAIVLAATALIGTVDIVRFGHALHHLRIPAKFVHLLLFTIRYLHVLHEEYCHLRNAMRVRGFRARFEGHTYRSLAQLAGTMVVNGLDHSERVSAAMKCRGFRGRFYLLDHFRLGARDVAFGAGWLALLALLGCLQWTQAFF